MPRKKIEVVELNKKEEQIILEEKQSALILFWRRHSLLIFLTLLILALTILGVSLIVAAKNLGSSGVPNIKEVSITTTLDEYNANVIAGNKSLTDESAKSLFDDDGLFKKDGEVLLIETIEHNAFTLKYYSDGTALKIMKVGNMITRIGPLENGQYGISRDGVISSKAPANDVSVTKTKEYPWGTVTYYSDGSAEISNSKEDIFVRNSNDINDNYISDNKVSYLKDTKTVGNIKLNYYYDGTIEVIKNNKSYLVRTSDDLNITSNDVTFKNNNAATIISSKKMSDGRIVDYYEDGGAIIRDGNKTLSVRKSNSIIIKDNKIYEIVDNIYVTVSKETANAKYYTNGSAVINYNGTTYYVPENSNIKYNDNGSTKSIGSDKETKSKETNIDGENVKIFEKTAVITNDKYIAIVPADKVIYDDQGKVKEIEELKVSSDKNSFKIINNTNKELKYRVVIEQSERTTVNVTYLRYMISTKKGKSTPSKLKEWPKDEVSKALDLQGTNYLLIDSTIAAQATEDVSVMLWADYDTIPNSEQDKYFYGTIKVYAWTED